MSVQLKISALQNAISKDKMLTNSWINYQEIYTATNPDKPLIVDYLDFLSYILKISIAHDNTSLLSGCHANLTLTGSTGDFSDDLLFDVPTISAPLAELGLSEEILQEYQVRAANRKTNLQNRRDRPSGHNN